MRVLSGKQKTIILKMLDFALLFASVVFLFAFRDFSVTYKHVLGIFILIVSVVLLLKARKNRFYSLLFGIILYCNITIVFSDCFNNGVLSLPSGTLSWQIYRNTKYEIFFLCALYLFMTVVNLFIKYMDAGSNSSRLERKDNILVFLMGFSILVYGLFAGYSDIDVANGYASATSALYEYCVLFFLLTWFHSGESKFRQIFLLAYAAIYVFQSVFYGDRSAAFPMILLLCLLYLRKISIKRLVLYAFIGISFANIISTYRTHYTVNDFLDNYTSRYSIGGFMSDTVSQAYYTGITMVATRDLVASPANLFPSFVKGVVVGGDSNGTHLTTFTSRYIFNKGGGMIVSNFYFWFNYIGVLLFAISIGLFIRLVQLGNNSIFVLWRVYLTTSVFRWYLYGAFNFCRGVMFVFPVSYLIFYFVSKIASARKAYEKSVAVSINTKKETAA